MFTQHKDDRKRVEKALESTGHSVGKNDSIPIQKFQFEDFFTFYKALTQRTDVEKIFDQLVGNSKKKLMSAAQLVEFLNQTQRDPRLNEILHPYANTARAMEIITQYEPSKANAQKGYLSSDGFLRYLMSEDNPIMAVSKFELSDDMDQPLAHYFINSSHNTYLTGHQLTGKSSVEIYRQCLLAGCRCVELDFWNGKDAEPVIVHGYTFVPEISARDVLEAIAESAFKTSEYPVILSFENHCNPRQQAKIAQYCREFFGDMLLETPLESHKLEPGQELPPPALLRRKIIIKNKKKHHHHKKHQKKAHQQQPSTEVIDEGNEAGEDNSSEDQSAKGENGPPPDIIPQNEVAAGETASLDNSSSNGGGGNTGVVLAQQQSVGNGGVNHPPMLQNRQSSKDSAQDEEDEDEESSLSEEESNVDPVTSEKAADAKETEAGAEISALVNYVQPVHFISFEVAEKKNRLYEMSSFDEKQATMLLKERPLEFVNYNKHQLSRVYPSGTRFDSSNFMPQVFWNAGCQLVALNYQTMGKPGYAIEPGHFRVQQALRLSAQTRIHATQGSTIGSLCRIDGRRDHSGNGAYSRHIGSISNGQKSRDLCGSDMYGLPADTVRKKFRTKIVPNNGINPVYDEEPFIFKKVVLPELASIRIAAYEESGKMIGHRVLPVIGLCPGYRHVALRTECGQSLPLASLFLHVIVKDYVPHGLSDFAEALANPIKYQSELEKRTQQLSVLTDDLEEPKSGEVEEETSALATTAPATAASVTTSGAASSSAKSTQRVRSIGELSTNLAPSSIGSPHGRPSIGAINSADSQELEDGVSALAVTVVDGSSNKSPLNASTSSFSLIAEDIVAESLEKLMENKLVKEKKMELEKKLESLKKKQEKQLLERGGTERDLRLPAGDHRRVARDRGHHHRRNLRPGHQGPASKSERASPRRLQGARAAGARAPGEVPREHVLDRRQGHEELAVQPAEGPADAVRARDGRRQAQARGQATRRGTRGSADRVHKPLQQIRERLDRAVAHQGRRRRRRRRRRRGRSGRVRRGPAAAERRSGQALLAGGVRGSPMVHLLSTPEAPPLNANEAQEISHLNRGPCHSNNNKNDSFFLNNICKYCGSQRRNYKILHPTLRT
ncbi:unnamed protein product [Trichogramma brassicae]|uniref:Phosphoinositide phospholipase C n=1 Tax=Trichogramma brassicae TaxID=86971 RepID=A0A6H5J028_9HYME|nr:unnamed protein product [Trichogramma brassicae]